MKADRTPFQRLRLLRLGFLISGLLIIAQLFRIQVLSHSFYVALANGQHELFQKLFPARGKIYARDKRSDQEYLLATNQTLTLVYADPESVKDPKGEAAKLAPLLAMDPAELKDKLTNDNVQYRPLKRLVTDDLKNQIAALKLDGIGFAPEDHRFYPEADSAAQVLGFVGSASDGARVGHYGVEGYFDEELAGTQGSLEAEKDSFGRFIAIGKNQLKPARDGDDLLLTVDRTVEYVVCNKLRDWVTKHGASRGSVVIMRPKTGEVLAMCDAPSFDPNAYNKVDDAGVYNNTAIFDAYEPGSVFKTITMATALDTGKIAPSTTFNDPGEARIGPFTIRNADLMAHGLVDMTTILAMSLNTGIVHVEQMLDPGSFLKYVRDFGFGERAGIELQTESPGNVDSLTKKGDIWPATASFGQGLSVTALQLAAAYSAIANGGVLMKPMIISEVRHPDGTVEKTEPKMVRRVISERTANLLTGMLVAVVEKGEGKRAAVKGYWVGGKTGTAQIPKKDGTGYETGATIGSFVGFAPIDDPRFTMIVRIDRPKDVQFAESAAAPLFGDIAKYLLDYYEIPPTRN